MTISRLTVFALPLAVLIAGPPAMAAPACDLAAIKGAAALQTTLGKRAVEVIQSAAKSSKADRARLAALVVPDAPFMLGSGDVGNTLGTGPEGAVALAKAMRANLFILEGWDYMDMPVEDACAEQKVAVEFLDNRVKRRCRITFTFVNGRVTAAEGWERSYTTGPLTPPK